MSFDTFSVAAMAAELRSVILGGRVQRVTQIDSLTYGFEIYVRPVRHYLVVSVEPRAARFHLTLNRVRRGAGNDTPLQLVLRKYMRGARLKQVEQPPYERLLYLHFDTPFGPVVLAIEMLGNRSNLLFQAEDQTILGVARLSKPEPDERGHNRQRSLIPGHLYQPPPPQDKLAPSELTEHTLRQELAEASPDLRIVRLLPGVVRGVGPLLAREITVRATGSVDTTAGQLTDLAPFLEVFRSLFDRLASDEWQPTLAFDEEGELRAFAPYPLRHFPHSQTVESFSVAVETFFAEAAAGYATAKAPLVEAIAKARNRLERRRARLAEDAAALADPTAYKESGEAILAYAHQIQPGQTTLAIEWVLGEEPLDIELDPALSASENAQQYFNRYRKALRAAEEIPAQVEKVSLEEQYLDQLEQDLAMADDRPEIDVVAESLAEAGYYRSRRGRKQRQKRASGRYLRLTAPDGALVWVGKNALQNAHLTFNRAAADDLWLHARNIPGAHVIIPTAEGLPSEADVFWAAGVAAYFSRARHDTRVDVVVTVKKYVRAIKGAAPGLVTYRNETTLRVAPEAPELE
jgi:predicted ribosome quality control (RQC) complex YloA/Tae2 family protein